MATLPSSTVNTLTLDSSSLFLDSFKTFSNQYPQNSPPQSFNLLSQKSPLPPIPSNFPKPKLVPKTRFIVDGFKFSGDFSVTYFLSHFHFDHYTGLNANWSKGLIFCSEITGKLLIEALKISPLFVVSLPLREQIQIDECMVTLSDANHCPGAVQFLFRIPVSDGRIERYIHTGDFRYCNSMKLEPVLQEFIGADAVFLDTTYCNPKFVFPAQEESVEYIVKTIERIRAQNVDLKKSVLFLVATYVVGKEKILLEIARQCCCLVYVDSRKMAILNVLGFGDCGVFTVDASASDVHVIGWNLLGETWPYFRPNFVKIKEIMTERGYSKAVGFVPTGWMYETKRDGFAVRAKDSYEIHLVPYSEHSSYDELREYVRFLRPKSVVPTVGLDVDKLDGKHAVSMRKHFAGLLDEMANKSKFLMGFQLKSQCTDEKAEDVAGSDLKKETDTENEEKVPSKLLESSDSTDPGTRVSLTYSVRKPGSRDSVVLHYKDTEEMVQELCDCLPIWVTHDQMLDLLTKSGGDIVEAVSDFYERETELHGQATDYKASVVRPQTGSLFDSTSDTHLPFTRSALHETVTLNQNKKSSNTSIFTNNIVSPKKRSTGLGNELKKKSRLHSTSDSSISKQSTITKFFNKLIPNASVVGEVSVAKSKQGANNETLMPNTVIEPYKEDLDQFLQIINGGISRKAAASILEKANGNVNLALDMHYNNNGGVIDSREGTLNLCSTSTQTQKYTSCSTANESKSSEETTNVPNKFINGLSTGNVDPLAVSLPLEKYSPLEHACWSAGEPAPYLHLARTFDLVEQERGKIKATGMLCNMFRSLLALSPEDVLPAVYLCTNKIAADHENMELNIGGSLISAALQEACGTTRAKIRDTYNHLGDLGDVAQVCRQTQSLLAPPPPLSIQQVFAVLRKISVEAGSGSSVRKKNLVVNLMRSCREKEMKFLVRTLVHNLRIGAMMRTILPALGQAVLLNSSPYLLHGANTETLKMQLQHISGAVVEAYNILPSLDLLVPSLLSKGIDFSSTTLSMKPGVPIRPMLARITNGVNQVLKLFQGRAFTCEYKYDGQRAQIHKLMDGSLQVFSRNGEGTTSRFPDLVNIIKEVSKPSAMTFILDAEVVAVDRKNGNKLMSFQQLSSRERGGKDSSITADSVKVDICAFVFDIMFANGDQLLGLSLRQRRKYLKNLFSDEKLGYFEFAKELTVEADEACLSSESTLAKINSFLKDAFNSSCEGVMVKSLDVDAGYAASKRTDTWLKVKRDYLEGMNDTLDLVPIGAWHGNGRKAGWYSPFLMACYNPDTEEFQSVCRVMSGFSDIFYTEMKDFFSNERMLSKKPPYYQTAEVPDMWFSPELVWEIRGADFTISPVHKAAIGLVHPSKGISVRFPRFIRSVSDRRPEDCSTSADIADMFQSQTRKMEVSV